jgi:hypothetical protein
MMGTIRAIPRKEGCACLRAVAAGPEGAPA